MDTEEVDLSLVDIIQESIGRKFHYSTFLDELQLVFDLLDKLVLGDSCQNISA